MTSDDTLTCAEAIAAVFGRDSIRNSGLSTIEFTELARECAYQLGRTLTIDLPARAWEVETK